MAKDKPEFRVELLCRKLVEVKGGKLSYEWRIVNRDPEGRDTFSDERLYYTKIRRGAARVGSVYSFAAIAESWNDPDKRSLMATTLRWERGWHDTYRAAEWETEARGLAVDFDARKRRDKDEKESSAFRDALEPIRKAYWRTNKAGQAAIVAMVIQELQRIGNLEED